jgi:hypothetical protein
MKSNTQNFTDNELKKEARQFLVNMCNYYFKGKEFLTMLELLGSGVGADFYANNIRNISKICAIERDLQQFKSYIPLTEIIKPYHSDLIQYLYKELCVGKRKQKFDILNMDFCSYFCDEQMDSVSSTGHMLRYLLFSRLFKKKSIIFTTFLLDGIHVRLSKYRDSILTNEDDIKNAIVKMGKEYNVKLEPLDETFLYKPGKRGWNKMMHTGFVVKDIGGFYE